MAGSLIKIDEEIVTSAVASVTLTGIDSTYDVYMVKYNKLEVSNDANFLVGRFTVSGTPDTSANYDYAYKDLKVDTTFGNESATNLTYFTLDQTGTGTGEQINGVIYLFNFNNASEYSFITQEGLGVNSNASLRGRQGGAVLTVAQACDGIQIYPFSSGNIDSGTFTLYGLKK